MKALQKDLFFRQKASQVGDFIPRQAVSSWSYSNTQEINPGARSETRMESGGREGGPEEDQSLGSEAQLGAAGKMPAACAALQGPVLHPLRGWLAGLQAAFLHLQLFQEAVPALSSRRDMHSSALIRGQVATRGSGRSSQGPFPSVGVLLCSKQHSLIKAAAFWVQMCIAEERNRVSLL